MGVWGVFGVVRWLGWVRGCGCGFVWWVLGGGRVRVWWVFGGLPSFGVFGWGTPVVVLGWCCPMRGRVTRRGAR